MIELPSRILGDAHSVKGSVLWAQGRFDEAIVECEAALALDPTIAYAYQTMANAYRLKGQFEKSLELVDKAILISPRENIAWWYQTKSLAYFALKDYDKAVDWAQRATVASPNMVLRYSWSGTSGERPRCRCSGVPVVSNSCVFLPAHEAAGAALHPAFPAPSI